MADQPSWITNTAQISNPGDTGGGVRSQQGGAPSQSKDAMAIRSAFHVVNIGVSIMMAASSAFGLIEFSSAKNVVLAIYLMIFAVLLFLYEMVRVMMRCERVHQIMLKNFGFFFGAKGRGLYLIFIGFLNFPLKSHLSDWTGYVVIGWGVITVITYMSRPEWFEVPKPPQTMMS